MGHAMLVGSHSHSWCTMTGSECRLLWVAGCIPFPSFSREFCRCAGAEEVSACCSEWRGLYTEAVAGLISNVSHTDRALRNISARSLASVADTGDKNVVAGMLALLRHEEDAVRTRAVEVLQAVSRIGDEDVLVACTQLVADENRTVRRMAGVTTVALLKVRV